ncbi:hypothetical protein L3Q82_002829 [Scortum barcoo]|uniref:Uncharacterized protein n=1 Tax=Scortum barcoo TaxID=214431 RepID=A0ACB8VUZ0_9TELE|nr:hypothetical protein L3Q82_002829 [Scortum barcoo]
MKFAATSSYDAPQSVYEDPDASVPVSTNGCQSEVQVKPVPLPRSKLQPKAQCNTDTVNNNTVDSIYAISNEASEVIYTDDSLKSNCSSIGSLRRTSVSPAPSEEAVSLCETYGSTATDSTDSTDKPAVPPRLGQPPTPSSVSAGETSPPQTRPPPPKFSPPPPPSIGTSQSIYSEIEPPPYLDVLPEEDNWMHFQTHGRSTVRFEKKCHQQATEGTEDINGMLRWLTRISKSDSMAPSLYGLSIEEEIRSFHQRAMNVQKALRLYNLLMMKRNESLRDIISEFSSISDTLDKIKKKTKTMEVAGGTTGAVGGVTAVLGIALAPMTLGASLIATAVGAGMVASAGGMGAHTAKANKKIVNKMRVEKLVYDYKGHIVDLEHCLDFILIGMNELRRHDIARLQRAGAQPEALKMAHLSQSVFRNNMNSDRKASVVHTGGMSSEKLLQSFAKELDQYFTEKEGPTWKPSLLLHSTA